MELLAPAGNEQALFQAVAHGADAVYLGYTAFSARQGAGNFNEEELHRAIKLCHTHHVRVYVAVNTLVREDELPMLLQALHVIHEAHADAVIVQDIGAAALIQKHFPGLPIHASTQMALHNVQGMRFAKAMGMSRVVLGRECSLSEVTKACQEGLEIEVFVHGALCISQSGECLFSSMVGGRSGNRGRCAQPCRMNYTFEGKSGAFLSPRDIMLLEEIPLLKQAGVTSLKIEGRLKRPEYVAAVVSAYRRALDGQSLPQEQEREALLQIYNRGGFMRGHLMDDQDAGIVYTPRVSHLGLPIGRVTGFYKGMARILLERDLNDGDGLSFRGQDDVDSVYSGKALSAGETALCRTKDSDSIRVGTEVSRITDSVQMKTVMKTELAKIPVDMQLKLMPGELAVLTVNGLETIGTRVQTAQKAALSHDKLREIMTKTGQTDFEVQTLMIESENAFMPVSQINELRRTALRNFADKKSDTFYHSIYHSLQNPTAPKRALAPDAPLPALHEHKAILTRRPDLFETSALNLYDPLCYDEDALDSPAMPYWLCLPSLCQADTLDDIVQKAEARRGQVLGLVLGSVGQLGLRTTLPLGGGEGIPVWNRQTAQTLINLGLRFLTASPELSFEHQKVLTGYPMLLPVYGRTRLMTLSHCPRRTAMGLTKNRANCNLCDEKPLSPLIDRMNAAFPLQRQKLPEGCRIKVLNSVPLNIKNEENKINLLGFVPMDIWTDENEPLYEKGTKGRWNQSCE